MPLSAPMPSSESQPSVPPKPKGLAGMEPSKKYTLIFLVSVGTTLLLTGASGGRLLKRAKKVTATPLEGPTAPKPTPVSLKPKSQRPAAIPVPRAPSPPPIAPEGGLSSWSIAADPLHLSRPAPRGLLRSFRVQPPSPPSALPQSPYSTSFFLPNSAILERSTAFAQKMDKEEREHKDGPERAEVEDDGFNPAIYAAKAFGIATVLTVSVFGAGIYGLMRYFGVEDLESLSLALSHSLPTKISASRPHIPSALIPSSSPSSRDLANEPGEEEEHPEHKAGVAYWMEVKETLDREAREHSERRRAEWEAVQRARRASVAQDAEGRQV